MPLYVQRYRLFMTLNRVDFQLTPLKMPNARYPHFDLLMAEYHILALFANHVTNDSLLMAWTYPGTEASHASGPISPSYTYESDTPIYEARGPALAKSSLNNSHSSTIHSYTIYSIRSPQSGHLIRSTLVFGPNNLVEMSENASWALDADMLYDWQLAFDVEKDWRLRGIAVSGIQETEVRFFTLVRDSEGKQGNATMLVKRFAGLNALPIQFRHVVSMAYGGCRGTVALSGFDPHLIAVLDLNV